ncbi:hypothetical protein AB4Y85_00465 [Microvirga sp. 2YAF29]|uniref:hypothetical protein n=1 Tax=Microvirga sp. 2YAF29 TaxID=3233031 RepID=UPI003F9955B9
MLLSASEGRHWRYEVCEHEDGYLVQMRDLSNGDLDEEFSTIFRTLPVAFAYAEMSAAYERYAASELEHVEDAQIEIEVETTEKHFIDLSDRLHDSGINGIVIQTWERESQRSAARMLH